MYASFFGLKQDPFSIAPDPRYLFMSERHREALAHLLYGLSGGGGFVLLSGEIGTGKTTVCRCFLEQIPENCNVAYIFNPKLTANELLRTVCDEFRIAHTPQGPGGETIKDCIDPLNAYLLAAHAAGRHSVLIIDEAQNLSAEVLEQLRLLTNLETNERKLLQIILIGQPELRRMLARPELEQLAQRVIARFHLDALSADETAQYIGHRLAVAGRVGPLPFDARAMQRIHQVSRGVPRRINLLCDRALLGAYAHGQTVVGRPVVDKAAAEVFGNADDQANTVTSSFSPGRSTLLGLGAVGGLAVAGIVTLALNSAPQRPVPAPSPAATGMAVAAPSAPTSRAPSSAASVTAAMADADALKAWLAAAPRNENDAWQQLGTVWNLNLPDADTCQAAQQQQVQCWRSSGANLSTVRQLGRPGLLVLHDGERRPAYAVLTGLGDQHAELQARTQTIRVPLAALAGYWRGDFAMLWRTPPGYGAKPAGTNSAPVEWLDTQLAKIAAPSNGATAWAATPLKARIAQFQVTQGLTPDGVAGPITLMQLNRAAGIDEPRLKTETNAGMNTGTTSER
jgi:general secretion pathway protein A